MIEYPIAIRLVLFCIYVVLIWRYRATFKVLEKAMPWVIGVLMTSTIGFICILMGAYQVAGAEAANKIIPLWAELLGIIWATAIGLVLFLYLLIFIGGVLDGLAFLANYRPKEKSKRESSQLAYVKSYAPGYLAIGYTTGGTAYREEVYKRLGEDLHGDDDNPFIDLRYTPDVSSKTV